MLKNYAFAVAALLFGAFAANAATEDYHISPDQGTVTEMPAEFVITIDGCTSLTKNTFQNAVKVYQPGSDEFMWSTYTLDGNKVNCKTSAYIDRTLKGDYKVELVVNSLYLNGNTSTPCENVTFTYTTGNGGGGNQGGGDYGDLVSSDYQLNVTPQPGDCAKLNVITVAFPEWADADIARTALNNGLVTLSKDGTVIKQFAKAEVNNAYDDMEEVIAFTVSPAITSDEAGLYTLTIPAGALSLIAKETFETSTNVNPVVIKWNIVGEVAYTAKPISVKPKAGELDLREIQFECFLINVEKDILPVEGAKINFKSVDGTYNQSFDLQFNFGTQLVAWVPSATAPKYNGEYILTIPQGCMGDSNFRSNPEIGIANPLLEYNYTIVGGRNNDNVEYDLNPVSVTPEPGNVGTLKEIVFTFADDVLFKDGATLEVAAAWGSRYSCTAPIQRVDSKTVKIVLSPAPYESADYAMYVAEGTFYDAAHEADSNEGRANDYLSYVWTMGSLINVNSTNPEDESQLDGLDEGFSVALVTDDSLLAKSVTLQLIQTDNLTTDEKVILNNVPMTRSNRTWTWTNTGNKIPFYVNNTYTFNYVMYGSDNNIVYRGSFYVDGTADSNVGVSSIVGEQNEEAPIFNMQGIRINADAKELPAGLYIIGDKKIVIK